MYSSLPVNKKSFDFDVVGEDTGMSYKGTFTAKCVLNTNDRHRRELEKTRLQADYQNPSVGLSGIATALSSIRVRIETGPAWWVDTNYGGDIIDQNIILELYDKCLEMEQKWKDDLKAVSEAAKLGNV